jgi:hypothetical protein
VAVNGGAGDQAENKDGARQPPPNSLGKRHLGCILRLNSRAYEVPASVVREMWDSTALRLVSVQVVKGRPTVAPHISRKTIEIWGTRL